MERKTAKNYLRELTELENKRVALSKRITDRLIFLCKTHPEIPVGRKADNMNDTKGGTIIYAKSIGNPSYLNSLKIHTIIAYISIIEKELAKQEPYVQGNLFNL